MTKLVIVQIVKSLVAYKIKNLIESQIDQTTSELKILDLRHGKIPQDKIDELIEDALKMAKISCLL